MNKDDYYYLLNRVDNVTGDMNRMGYDLKTQIHLSHELTNLLKTTVQELKELKQKNTELRAEITTLKEKFDRSGTK